jgi:acyl dehydratase
MTWGTITEERIAEAETLIGVSLRRERMQWIEAASRDTIRHFAWGVGDNNPLWLDLDYGKATRFGCNLAPPCILYAVDNTVVAPKLPGVQWIYAGTGWTWFEPILMGDTFTAEVKLIRQEVKRGRRFPMWVLQTGEIRYFNQHRRLVAIAVGRCARTPRGDNLVAERGEGARAAAEPHHYSAEELESIEREILAEPRRGETPLHWEEVSVGDDVPQVVRGPLNLIDIMAWYSAQQGAQPYGGVHGDAVRYRQRHQDYHVNKATGAKESAGRGHLEAGTGRDVGMGGAYDIGPQRISWCQHMLTNWIGDSGFLRSLDVKVERPNVVGDTVWWKGKVTSKRLSGNYGIVDLDVIATNQKQAISARGTASVILPSAMQSTIAFPVPEQLK